MVACIVVDVYRYGAEGGDFLLEGGEGVVVLAGGVLDGWEGWEGRGDGRTVLARRLRTLWRECDVELGGLGEGVVGADGVANTSSTDELWQIFL